MKKFFLFALVLMMSLTMMVACGSNEPEPTPEPETPPAEDVVEGYKDGTYFAEEADFNAETGWKDNATVTVTDGKISDVVFNATYKDDTKGDKLSEVAAGNYDMSVAGAQAAWDVQAKAIQDYVVSTQDFTSVEFNEEGKSDAISGATISYQHFFTLIEEALAQAK